MAQEIDDRLRKFLTYPGVQNYIIVNHEGIPIKTSFADNAEAVHHAALVLRFINLVRKSVRQMDASNNLMWTRLRSKQDELIIIPERDFIVVLVQKPTD